MAVPDGKLDESYSETGLVAYSFFILSVDKTNLPFRSIQCSMLQIREIFVFIVLLLLRENTEILQHHKVSSNAMVLVNLMNSRQNSKKSSFVTSYIF